MSNHPDDVITPIGPAAVRNGANIELARVVGNMVLEAQAFRSGLNALYNQLCAMEGMPPKSWGAGLVEQYEQHMARIASILPPLKAAVG